MSLYPNILKLYDENADFWLKERSKTTFVEKKYLDWVLNNIKSPGEILDLGCGDGWPIASYFIEKGFKVTGVDGAKNMLEGAKLRFPDQSWILEDMRKLNLNKRFEAIIAWDSFFHLSIEDQPSMFQIFQRHLAPEGCLLFTSGPSRGEAIGELNGQKLFHASLSPEEYRTLFNVHGFKEVAFNPEDRECGFHTIWRCKY